MRDEIILIYSRSGSWGTRCLSSATIRLFAASGPACVGTQSILPCSVRTPCWPPVSPALRTPSTRTRTLRALLRGGGCHCSRFGPATHFSLGNIPSASTGSTGGSKQRLRGFCSTAIVFLPPTERSDRGNTAVGHRTRVLQPKGDGGLRPILDLRRLNFDWLILAHSRELVSRHRDIVLGHIHSLGLRMNAKKSVLLPSQRTVFLGVRLDSVQMQAY